MKYDETDKDFWTGIVILLGGQSDYYKPKFCKIKYVTGN